MSSQKSIKTHLFSGCLANRFKISFPNGLRQSTEESTHDLVIQTSTARRPFSRASEDEVRLERFPSCHCGPMISFPKIAPTKDFFLIGTHMRLFLQDVGPETYLEAFQLEEELTLQGVGLDIQVSSQVSQFLPNFKLPCYCNPPFTRP